MYYEITVAKNGVHLFAMAERSAQSPWNARAIYEEIKTRFPEEEGYQVTVTRWKKRGEYINLNILPWEDRI